MRLMPGLILAATSLAALTAATLPADAACKKMGFLVNDYGKDGPTKDAQELLEKDIAKWAASEGISNYTVSNRDVKCELFLDVILFDEHTCTASANVCWDEKNPNAPKSTTKSTDASVKPATAKSAEKKAAAKASAKKPDAAAPSGDAAPAESAADKAVAAPVETTGALPDAKADAVNSVAPTAPAAEDAAKTAAAAAERAAAAAERAAAAAERAAKAASVNMAPADAGAAPSGAIVDPVTPSSATP